ncbi:MAG: hypothetical protein J4G12_09505 [Gemmatimonadetes bacterium]|nr:hypothetical protein [Gemmatimonadota bacterium]
MATLAKSMSAVALALIGGAIGGSAQQIVEVDFNSGRHMIDDEWRAITMESDYMALDRTLGVLYVKDLEDVDAVMVFSMETGERVRTIPVPRGDGPAEIRKSWSGIAAVPGEGIFVKGQYRVIEFDTAGQFISLWQPEAPGSRDVCNFGGQPAVPVHDAVLLRAPTGDRGIGPRFVPGRLPDPDLTVFVADVDCTRDVAYVLFPNRDVLSLRDVQLLRQGQPPKVTDYESLISLVAYSSDGETSLTIPGELFDPSGGPYGLSLDDHGNLVLLTTFRGVQGAIFRADGGCHAVVRTDDWDTQHKFMRVYADSALVFRRITETRNVGGRETRVMYQDADGVSLHPFRHVSGDPCPGILPSLDRETGRNGAESAADKRHAEPGRAG